MQVHPGPVHEVDQRVSRIHVKTRHRLGGAVAGQRCGGKDPPGMAGGRGEKPPPPPPPPRDSAGRPGAAPGGPTPPPRAPAAPAPPAHPQRPSPPPPAAPRPRRASSGVRGQGHAVTPLPVEGQRVPARLGLAPPVLARPRSGKKGLGRRPADAPPPRHLGIPDPLLDPAVVIGGERKPDL